MSIWNRLRGQTAATVCFLLLAGLFVYACIMLVGSVLRQELTKNQNLLPDPPAEVATQPTPLATPEPADPLSDVSSILVPQEPGEDGGMAKGADAQPTPSREPEVTATPEPTLLPLQNAAPVSNGYADFVLVGFDAHERADWFAIVSMQESGCMVLSVPRNTLSASGTPLMQAASANHALRLLRTVWPVSYQYYVDLKLSGVPLCVDQCGGVTIDDKAYTGEQAQAYLEESDADELLRIERQQALMRAYLKQLQQTSWLKLLTFRFTLQKLVDSNFTTTQLLALYTHFKQIDVDAITFCTLPVDSINVNGKRHYTADVALVNRMLEERGAD